MFINSNPRGLVPNNIRLAVTNPASSLTYPHSIPILLFFLLSKYAQYFYPKITFLWPWFPFKLPYSLPLLSPLQSFILYSLPYSLITLIKLSSIISLKSSSLLSIQSCSTSLWYWFISHSSHSTVFFSWLMISFSLAFFLLPKSFNSQYYLLLFFFFC